MDIQSIIFSSLFFGGLSCLVYRHFKSKNPEFYSRLELQFLGLFIVPIAILTAKDGKFRKCFYWWDNEEDGYTGNKRNWLMDNRPNLNGKWWSSYNWSALRNMAWNARYHPKCSISALGEDVTEIRFEGNTHNKDYRYSLASYKAGKVIRERIWFKFSAIVDGKRRYCEYEMVPINDTESRETLTGWKFYPNFYLEHYWVEKIKREGWPDYKDRLIYTMMNKKVKE